MVGVHDDQRPQPRTPQPIEQRRVHARRNRDRPAGVDPQAAQVRDRGELRLQSGERVVVERQRIAAREDHLVNRRIGAHVVDRALERLVAQRVLAVREVAAKAVAAVHRAGAGDDQQHAARGTCGAARAPATPRLRPADRRSSPPPARISSAARRELAQKRIVGIAAPHPRHQLARHAEREAPRGFTRVGGVEESRRSPGRVRSRRRARAGRGSSALIVRGRAPEPPATRCYDGAPAAPQPRPSKQRIAIEGSLCPRSRPASSGTA